MPNATLALDRASADIVLSRAAREDLERAANEAGHPVAREFYADRDYDESGSIVFTRDAGRPDPAAIARKVVRACKEGRVTAITGKDIEVPFETICFHSDTLGALDIVRTMREALIAEGIRISPLSEIMNEKARHIVGAFIVSEFRSVGAQPDLQRHGQRGRQTCDQAPFGDGRGPCGLSARSIPLRVWRGICNLRHTSDHL